MFKVVYTISSVLLFALVIISVARLGISGVDKASADNTVVKGWVDGTVYSIDSEGKKQYLSSNEACGTYVGPMKVNGKNVNKCSGNTPYYNFTQNGENNSFRIDLPNDYNCNSWVAVNAENPSEVVAYGKCSGKGYNLANFDNPENLNISLWWKVDRL